MAVENQIIVEIVSWGPKGEPGEFQVATNWLGVYNPATAYVQNDGVKFNGSAYTCLAAVTGEDPDASASWLLIVEKGDASTVTGPVGPEGPVGPQGVPGRLSIYGTAVPTTEGVDGDFYIKTDTYDLYGPKTAGAWGTPTSLIGLTGPTGPQGAGASTWAEIDLALSALADIADVPTPIANKALKRAADGLSYEWGEAGIASLESVPDVPAPVSDKFLKRNLANTAYVWEEAGGLSVIPAVLETAPMSDIPVGLSVLDAPAASYPNGGEGTVYSVKTSALVGMQIAVNGVGTAIAYRGTDSTVLSPFVNNFDFSGETTESVGQTSGHPLFTATIGGVDYVSTSGDVVTARGELVIAVNTALGAGSLAEVANDFVATTDSGAVSITKKMFTPLCAAVGGLDSGEILIDNRFTAIVSTSALVQTLANIQAETAVVSIPYTPGQEIAVYASDSGYGADTFWLEIGFYSAGTLLGSIAWDGVSIAGSHCQYKVYNSSGTSIYSLGPAARLGSVSGYVSGIVTIDGTTGDISYTRDPTAPYGINSDTYAFGSSLTTCDEIRVFCRATGTNPSAGYMKAWVGMPYSNPLPKINISGPADGSWASWKTLQSKLTALTEIPDIPAPAASQVLMRNVGDTAYEWGIPVIAALSDITDVPAPVADKVLKRAADGLSYEWGESGVASLETIGDVPTPIADKVLKRNALGTAYEWGQSGVASLESIDDVPAPLADKMLKRNVANTSYEWGDVPIGAFENLSDIPAPVAGMVLKRNVGGTAYEWADGGAGAGALGMTRVDTVFNGYAKHKIQADIVLEGTLEPTDYWSLFLDGNRYTASGVISVDDTFDTLDTTTRWITGGDGGYEATVANEKLRLKFNTSTTPYSTSSSYAYTRTKFHGGFEFEVDVSNVLLSYNQYYTPYILFRDTSNANSNLAVRIDINGGVVRLRLMANGVGPYYYGTNNLTGTVVGTMTTPVESFKLRMHFDGTEFFTLTLSEDNGQTWPTTVTVSAPQLAPTNLYPLDVFLGIKYNSSNTQNGRNWFVNYDNFTYKPINGGWAINALRPQRTLTEYTDQLISFIPTAQYTVARLSDLSFTVEKLDFGSMSPSYLAGASDSITIADIVTPLSVADTDYWELSINGTSYQITGATAAGSVNTVTDYFLGVINAISGIRAIKIDSTSLYLENIVPGTGFTISANSYPVQLSAINTTETSLYNADAIPVSLTGFTKMELTDNTLQKVLLRLDSILGALVPNDYGLITIDVGSNYYGKITETVTTYIDHGSIV